MKTELSVLPFGLCIYTTPSGIFYLAAFERVLQRIDSFILCRLFLLNDIDLELCSETDFTILLDLLDLKNTKFLIGYYSF